MHAFSKSFNILEMHGLGKESLSKLVTLHKLLNFWNASN